MNANISGFSSPSSMSFGEILWDLGGTLTMGELKPSEGAGESREKFRSQTIIFVGLKARWTFKRHSWDFPGGPVVKNPPTNAGNVGSIPGPGTEIPRVTGQLSPCATTPEPWHLEPVFCNKRSHCALQLKSSPGSPEPEEAHPQRWRPCKATNKINWK